MAARKRSKRPASIKGLSVSPLGNITARNLARLKGLSELSASKLDVLAERIASAALENARRYTARTTLAKACISCCPASPGLPASTGKANESFWKCWGPAMLQVFPPLLPDVRHNIRCQAFTDCQLGLISPKELVEDIVGLPFGDRCCD
jgi:hypothetical protein